MKSKSYSDWMMGLYPGTDCRQVTFQLTDDCPCECVYCYQINKGHKFMTPETGKKIVDLLFKIYEEDNPVYPITKQTQSIVFDFIGGEPLLNIKTADAICDYFIQKCLEYDSPWLYRWRASFTSNGAPYFNEDVQKFLKKFKNNVSMTFTLDGPQDVHDKCRKYHNGQGNFKDAFAAYKHYSENYNKINDTKVTIAPENLPIINEIIDFFVGIDIKQIYANCTFEAEWTYEQANIFYNQLKIIADKLLKSPDFETSLFDENLFSPLDKEDNQNYCGGTGKMLAFDPDGVAYPCLRYMSSSLGNNQPPLIIGDYNGIYQTDYLINFKNELDSITRESQSTKECFNCPIAAGCAWCFPKDTLIRTNNGYANIQDLKIGDEVIDAFGDTQKVENIFQREAKSDELVYIKAADVQDQLTTKNHPFLAKPIIGKKSSLPIYGETPVWVNAGDLKTGDKIGLYVPKCGNIDVDKNIAYLCGRYLGDGYKIDSKRKKHKYKYYIVCGFDEDVELESYFNKLPDLKFTKTKQRTNYAYNIPLTNNELMISIIEASGRRAINKKIPPQVFTWNKESIQAYIRGYLDADGYKSFDSVQQRYNTISKELAYGMAELIRMIYHKSVSISIRKPKKGHQIEGRNVNQHLSYCCSYTLTDQIRKFYEYDEKNNIMWVNVKTSKKIVPNSEIVYNLTVANSNTFLANDILVHNCSAWNFQLYGTANKRCTRICPMHKARALANIYYWNKKYIQENSDKRKILYLPEKECLKIIPKEEYNMLIELTKKQGSN